ncbi:hypothetical protein D915_009053 [Fasciola hepatica]|uniref:Palmitoyltransferase n=1 Tax=Fasciola hepatica TaxID=6192 RepID=A0A2H1BXA0_FASHE|nr:hypothetical protein D915_009053 [Fasciola hepatica]
MVLILSTWIGYMAWDARHSIREMPWYSNLIFVVALLSGWTFSLTTFSNGVQYAATNLTTNETINWSRYEYLHKKKPKGFHNPFDRGIVRNLLNYFGFGPELENYMTFSLSRDTNFGSNLKSISNKNADSSDPYVV